VSHKALSSDRICFFSEQHQSGGAIKLHQIY
jgi:hypothetical protein